MPRTPRQQPGGVIFHVLNRGNEQREIFAKDKDYAAFLQAVVETAQAAPMRLLAYAILPTHWHLVLWPQNDGDMGRFMQRLTVTHVRRWRSHRHSVGAGHLYQGTYKSFPVQRDDHFLLLCRHVERAPLRARLVTRAPQWNWTSLWQHEHSLAAGNDEWPALTPWPVPRPANWLDRVNRAETKAELDLLETSLKRGRPLGSESWITSTAARLGLTHTIRKRGRPSKQAK